MNVQTEYQKYCSWTGVSTLSEADYNKHLSTMRDQMGAFIEDPENRRSDIGKRIFDNLDLPTAVAFSRISTKVNARAKKSWFAHKAQEIVLKHVLQGTGYSDYLASGGWTDIIVLGLKVAGVAITITTGVMAAVHTSRIPEDAPRKTVTYEDEDGIIREVTYIDHPEARNANLCKVACAAAGSLTLGSIIYGLGSLLCKLDLNVFFSRNPKEESLCKDILGVPHTALLKKLVSPDYVAWRLVKMRENLISNPPVWRLNSKLRKMTCDLTGDFMLFPVKDGCGHYYDYRALRGYQLSTRGPPLECPLASKKPNTGLATIMFDMAKFNEIQRVLRGG